MSETTTPPATPGEGTTPPADGSILGGEGTADKGTAAPQGTTPVDFEPKVPEGVQMDAELLGAFKPLVKELNLQGPQAQKLVDLVVQSQQRAAEKYQQHVAQQVEAWRGAVKADKEIGGPNLTATINTCRKAVEKFGGDDLRKLLEETGLGNHPALVKAFYRAGKAISEDSIAGGIGPGANGTTAAEKQEALTRSMFPTMYKE